MHAKNPKITHNIDREKIIVKIWTRVMLESGQITKRPSNPIPIKNSCGKEKSNSCGVILKKFIKFKSLAHPSVKHKQTQGLIQ